MTTAREARQDALWDGEHAEEVERLHRDLEAVHGELTRLNDRYMILLKERSEWERTARAAARREAWRQVVFNHELYVYPKVTEPFSQLCGRIRALPDKPAAEQVDALKAAGRDVSRRLTEAAKDPQTSGQLDEMIRLRDAVQAQAIKLHEQFGDLSQGPCVCPGCELVRSIDDVPGEAS